MVQAKAKAMDRAVADPLQRKNVGSRYFKVFSGWETSKADAAADSSQKSFPSNGGLTQTTSGDVKKSCAENEEKTKAARDISGKNWLQGKDDSIPVFKINVRRKALADVSNVRSNLTSKGVCDGSKPFVSLPGARTVSVLQGKSLKGKSREKLAQETGEACASKKGPRALHATSDDQGTMTKGSHISTDRRRAQAPFLALPRKSLPTLQRNKQEKSQGLKVGKGRTSLPIKARVGHKLLPSVSNAQTRASRNRSSYEHIVTITKNRTNVSAYTSSIRKVGKNAVVTSNTQSTSQSKHVPEVDNSSSVSTVSSANKKETVPLPENIASTATEDVVAEIPSTDTSHPCKNKSDTVGRKKGGRRRSYTSLMMATSKLLGEHGEVQEEKLPSIDDSANQLEVAEYVDEIYEYYWFTEVQSPRSANFMSIQTAITPHMRGILINWLIEVHHKFDLMHETLYLMVTLLDRYLSQVTIKKSEMQLVGLTSLLLASKYEDFWHPGIKDLISISDECYTRAQVLLMEGSFLKQLKFRLNVATPYVFMLRFLKAAQSDMKLEHLAFYLIELCLVQYEAVKYKPSLLCASALYLARCTLQLSPEWTPLLIRHTRYEVTQMRECAEMILRFHKAARTMQLNVTYEKYKNPDRGNVAAIRPLQKLPA